jgi:hypothetical protein
MFKPIRFFPLIENKLIGKSPLFKLWGLYLGACITSVVFARLIYSILSKYGAQTYSQLIVGSITWRAETKIQDYLFLFSTLFLFLMIYFFFFFQASELKEKYGDSSLDEYHKLVVYSQLPFVLWLAQLIFTSKTSFTLPYISFILTILVFIFSSFLLIAKSDDQFRSLITVEISLIIVIFILFCGVAINLGFTRLNIFFNYIDLSISPFIINTVYALSLFFGIFLLIKIWIYSNSFEIKQMNIRKCLLYSQLPIPFLFFILSPTPWINENGVRFYGYGFKPLGWVVIIFIIILSTVDLFYRFYNKPDKYSKINIYSSLSPFCLIAILLFLKATILRTPVISIDDYHFGEVLIPWWSYVNFDMIPFKDFTPARGLLVNYLQGFFNYYLFDGTAASFEAAKIFCIAFYLMFCFPLISKSIGSFSTFLVLLLMPIGNNISEIDLMITAFLCHLCFYYFRLSFSRWTILWFFVCNTAILIAPGQGGLFVLATVPLGLYAIYKAYDEEKYLLSRVVIISFIMIIVISLITPIDDIVIGAVRYGYEQSSINNIAHSIEWSLSLDNYKGKINLWLFEIFRTSWVIVPMIAGILIFRSLMVRDSEKRRKILVYTIPIFILTALFIFRSAGRIGPNQLSRLGLASIWSLSMLFPILLINVFGKKMLPLILCLTVFFAGILTPHFANSHFLKQTGSAIVEFKKFLYTPLEAVKIPSNLVDGNRIGMPNIGLASIEENKIAKLLSIKEVFNALIDQGETYIDLTNRQAYYFYLNYKPPIETGAIYNLVSKNQQLRSIKAVKNNPPPVILASADNILHDGGTVSYRSPLIYRFFVQEYIPVLIGDVVYLVKPDRIERLKKFNEISEINFNKIDLLDRCFRMKDLQKLPIAWGQSISTLKKELTFIVSIDSISLSQSNSIYLNPEGQYGINGPNPYITFDLNPNKVNGTDAGILTFHFICNTKHPIVMKLYWGSKASLPSENTAIRFFVKNGFVVIPLDASPKWLLENEITFLKFVIQEPKDISSFYISDIKLWQRSIFKEIGN